MTAPPDKEGAEQVACESLGAGPTHGVAQIVCGPILNASVDLRKHSLTLPSIRKCEGRDQVSLAVSVVQSPLAGLALTMFVPLIILTFST
jgi:hypothetical protein